MNKKLVRIISVVLVVVMIIGLVATMIAPFA